MVHAHRKAEFGHHFFQLICVVLGAVAEALLPVPMDKSLLIEDDKESAFTFMCLDNDSAIRFLFDFNPVDPKFQRNHID